MDRLGAWSQKTLDVNEDIALEVVVDKFYERVLVDPSLVRFFEGHDHAKLRKHQPIQFHEICFFWRKIQIHS